MLKSLERSEEETALAKTVFDDFNSHGSAESRVGKTSNAFDGDEVGGGRGGLFLTGIETPLASAGPLPVLGGGGREGGEGRRGGPSLPLQSSSPPAEIQSECISIQSISAMKEQGNVLFKENRTQEALLQYRSALSDLNVLKATDSEIFASSDHEMVNMEVLLHSNCANALWRIVNADPSASSPPLSSVEDLLLRECEDHCHSVMKIDPLHEKMIYRLVHVLLLRDQPLRALEVVDTALETARKIGDRVDLQYTLSKLRYKCLASAIVMDHVESQLRGSHHCVVPTHGRRGPAPLKSRVSEYLPAKTIQVLNSILLRNQSSVRVPLPSDKEESDTADANTSKGTLLTRYPARKDPVADAVRKPSLGKKCDVSVSAGLGAAGKRAPGSNSAAVAAFVRLKRLALEFEKAATRFNSRSADGGVDASLAKLLEEGLEVIS